MIKLLIAALFLIPSMVLAQDIGNQRYSPEEAKRALQHNLEVSRTSRATSSGHSIARPFAEYEHTAVVAMSSDFINGSQRGKEELIAGLPANVKLAVTVNSSYEKDRALLEFKKYINADRIIFILNNPVAPNANASFWSRDSLPIPVYEKNSSGHLSPLMVRHVYHKHYEPDDEVQAALHIPFIKHDYDYVGGNLLSDTKGNCYRVQSHRGEGMPEVAFKTYYGCISLTQFKWLAGIGDIDERIKFLSDTVAVTDTPEYQPILEAKGFKVWLLPQITETDREFETYANAVLVNGTIFVPAFDYKDDEEAQAVYRRLGLKVVPVHTRSISDDGSGNIHCATMNYPDAAVFE